MLRKEARAQARPAEISDPELISRCPALFDHLTQKTWGPPGSEVRKTSTITIFCREDGTLGATLSDKEEVRTAFGVGTSLWTLLAHLEANVTDPNYVWRDDRQITGSSRRQSSRR